MSVAIVAGSLVAVAYAGIYHFLGAGPFALAVVGGVEFAIYLFRRDSGADQSTREDEGRE